MYRVAYLLVFVSVVRGQLILQGECNTVAGGYVTDLNITQMLGTWHQIARIANEVETGECSSLTLGGVGNEGIDVTHTEYVSGQKRSHNGTISYVLNVPGLYRLNLTGLIDVIFVVQATNYTDFAIMYSCTTLHGANATTTARKSVLAWQYHRTATLSASEDASIKEIIGANPDLRNVTWKAVLHDNRSCGRSGGVSLVIPHALIFLAAVLVSKEFV